MDIVMSFTHRYGIGRSYIIRPKCTRVSVSEFPYMMRVRLCEAFECHFGSLGASCSHPCARSSASSPFKWIEKTLM